MTTRPLPRIVALTLVAALIVLSYVIPRCLMIDETEEPVSSIQAHDCFDEQRRVMVCDGTERCVSSAHLGQLMGN